jgi:hypothetical protein
MVYQGYRHMLRTPGNNLFGARYMHEPAQLSAQIWATIASGGSGVFAFTYNFIGSPRSAKGAWTVFKDPHGQPTPFATALTAVYGQLRPFKRLIASWQRHGDAIMLPAANAPARRGWEVTAQAFTLADMPGQFLVVRNPDHTAAATVTTTAAGAQLQDVFAQTAVGTTATLPAGAGRIWYRGPAWRKVSTADWSLAGAAVP